MDSCSSCDLFSFWQTAFDQYADQTVSHLMPYVLPTMTAVLMLYWTLRITRYMAGASLDVADLGKEIMIVCISTYFATFQSQWSWLISTFLNQSVNITRAFISTTGGSTSREGLQGVLAAIGQPVDTIIDGCHIMWNSTGIDSIPAMVGMGILLAVYYLFWLVILIEVIWGYTSFMFIQVLGPLLLIFYCIPVLRGTATQAWKILLTGLFSLVTLGILTGICVSMLNKMVDFIPVKDGAIVTEASEYLFNQQYLVALGCGGLLLVLKGRFMHLASQLADSVMNSAPNIMGMASRGAAAVASGGATVANDVKAIATKGAKGAA